jgi:hypothetical protein
VWIVAENPAHAAFPWLAAFCRTASGKTTGRAIEERRNKAAIINNRVLPAENRPKNLLVEGP